MYIPNISMRLGRNGWQAVDVLEMAWNEKDKVWEYIPLKESAHGQEATGKSVPHNEGNSVPGSGKTEGSSTT
jgi:hypothetical protein